MFGTRQFNTFRSAKWKVCTDNGWEIIDNLQLTRASSAWPYHKTYFEL